MRKRVRFALTELTSVRSSSTTPPQERANYLEQVEYLTSKSHPAVHTEHSTGSTLSGDSHQTRKSSFEEEYSDSNSASVYSQASQEDEEDPPRPSQYRPSANKMPSADIDHAEENAEVEVLLSRAATHGDLNKKIQASLGRIQESGDRLRGLVGPAYNDTQALQVFNKNIDNILVGIERVRAPLEGKEDEERIIRGGPAVVGIQTYLASLRRVEDKYTQLNRANIRVNKNASDELAKLLNYGVKKLQELFDNLINEDSKPVEPLSYTAKGNPFPQIPVNKTRELNEINEFVVSTNPRAGTNSATIQAYSSVRGKYLAATLQNMSTASITTAKKRNPEDVYRLGQSTIGDYAQGIEGSFVAEWNNIVSIFKRDECGIAFELTTSRALGDFAKTLRELNFQIKLSIITDCFLAYEILDITNRLAYQMDAVTGQLKQQIVDAAKPIRDTAKLALSELLEDVRRRVGSMIMLPPDGASISYTTEVLKRLQTLTDFRASLASIMTSLGDGNWSTPSMSSQSSSRPLDVGPNANALLSHYVFDTLDALFSSLENKARSLYKSKALLGIFIANNVAIADRMVRTSELQSLLTEAPSSLPPKLEIWRKKGISAYLESWREPCSTLMEPTYTNRGPRPQSGGVVDSASVIKSLGSKEKDSIKEKFKTFNVLFESLVAKHKEMLPNMERDVRNQTSKEIAALVEPLYGRFWDRYHELDKGRGKYVKWDKGGLAGVLSALA